MIALDQSFDSEFANIIARLESYNKHLYRPNTYLHKWWARRCGTTFRLILKQLVPDEAARNFYEGGGLDGFVVLDPMMGGGTTLHEAIRLGANVIGADVDPIPILQAKASLSGDLSVELEQSFNGLHAAISKRLTPFSMIGCPTCLVKTSLRFTLYGLLRHCQCGPAIHVDSFILRQEGGGVVRRLCPICHQVHYKEECPSSTITRIHPPIYEKSTRRCPVCERRFKGEFDRPFYDRYVPLVSVGTCEDHGLFFKNIGPAELGQITLANDRRSTLAFQGDQSIDRGPKSNDLLRRGIASYHDLFSSRQLLYLHTAIDQLRKYDPDIRLPLALLVSTSLEFNTMLCGYKGAEKRRAGAIRHAFSHHAYSFPYTALENNPVYPAKASGTLRKLFYDRVIQAKKWAVQPKERYLQSGGSKYVTIADEVDKGTEVSDPAELTTGRRKYYLIQGSSTSLGLQENSVDFVVTDPPYYDSVEYGDLSAFFRGWLKQLVGNGVADNIVWDYKIPYIGRAGNNVSKRNQTYEQYLELMSGIFAECHRVLRKEQGRLVFTFHHWKADSWAALTIALRRAGFVLMNRYVVHSENPISVHINKLRALTDDAILVLAPAISTESQKWPKIKNLSFTDGAAFCSDCGSAIGWLLDTALSEEEIREFWQELLDLDTVK